MYYEPFQSDEAIEQKIKELKMKRNSGVKLTDKEVIELQRLIRTLASRKYRQRQSSKKLGGLIKTASGTGPMNEDCTIEDLNARIEHLEKTLS